MIMRERFLKYVSFDTQSDPKSKSYPSTAKQLELLNYLKDELTTLGASDVRMDEWGYVTTAVPATQGCEDWPVIGFLAHVDTSPDLSGAGVAPRVVENYDGGDIVLGSDLVLQAKDYPELQARKGETLVVTDGSTLLGADNKAGVAIIMTAVERLLAHNKPHGRVRVAFTPDEEIGRGVDHFDVATFGADFAYTVDGGQEGELEYENFNAAVARIAIKGSVMHPGYAKGRMKNALLVANEFISMLPQDERPENTEGREGFFHLSELSGDADSAQIEIIIRDHSREKFADRKSLLRAFAYDINLRRGENTVTIELEDQYYNMLDVIEARPEIIERAMRAMRQADVAPIVRPIRGGTDGARLSYMGLPCPNLFTGGANFHSRYEYCSLDTMRKAVATVLNICYSKE